MTTSPEGGVLDALYSFFSHARFARVMSTTVFATAFLGFGVRSLIGWPGYIAILSTEVLLTVVLVLARRRQIALWRAVPISLGLFMLWSLISMAWSTTPDLTLGAAALQWALAFVALGVANTRDSMQIIRSIGGVLRVTLAASLGLEILAGIVLGVGFPAWGISGDIASGAPISGLAGSRNALATFALLGIVTFAIELRTKSVSRRVGVFSLVGAGIVLVLTQSPSGLGTALLLIVVAGTLYAVRGISPQNRSGTQWVVAAALVVGVFLVWLFRSPIISLFRAQGTMGFRVDLWQHLWPLIQVKPLLGWGFVGQWPHNSSVVRLINFGLPSPHETALNSYLDAAFQVGIVGLVALVAMLGIALVRSWLLATTRQSEVYAWLPLVLTVILVSSLVESTVFTEWGWVIVVVTVARASQELSWRRR